MMLSRGSVNFDFNSRGFAAAETEPVAAEFNFNGVAKRRSASQRYFGSGGQSHFEQPQTDVVVAHNLRDAGAGADRHFRGRAHATSPSRTSTWNASF